MRWSVSVFLLFNQQCTAVGWNSRGAMIAATYGRNDHDSWCTHTGNVCTVKNFDRKSEPQWNLDRHAFHPRKPDSAIEIPVISLDSSLSTYHFVCLQFLRQACVSCVAWHPEQPSVLAVGAYNGRTALPIIISARFYFILFL